MKFSKIITAGLSFAAAFLIACGDDSSTQTNEASEQGSTNHSASGEVSYGVLVDDRDGQIYKTTNIGNLVWMAENLNYDYGEGSYCYDNYPPNCEKYGRLYTWDAAMNACPSGWFLPSKYNMESIRTDLVRNFDSIDFSDHFAGGYYNGGEFNDLSVNVRLWSSTEYSSDFFAFFLFGGGGHAEDRTEDKYFAFSVRCVQWQ